MTNRGHQNPVSCSFVPVMIPILIPAIRSLISPTKLELSFDLNPYLFLIEEFSSTSRNCFLFLRKSTCPDSVFRFLWIRHPGGCPSRDLSGGWWFLSLLDRILSHKPPWISLDILRRQSIRLCVYLLVVTLNSWGLEILDLLGSRVVDRWGCDLPFLFTALSVTNALSFQAHPSTSLAETLHREDQIFNVNDFDDDARVNLIVRLLFTQLLSANCDDTKEVISRMKNRLISENNHCELLETKRLVLNMAKQYTYVTLQPLLCSYAHTKEIQVQFDCASNYCGVELWLHQPGFPEIAMSSLHVGLVMYGWESLIQVHWKLGMILLKRFTRMKYFTMILVRKFWCHCIYISGLDLDALGFMLRFVKKRFSHKELPTNRNKEKSNMKLDNNGSYGRLASKATLRKASSNSLLLYFLLVYGAYICVCNNCVSIILYVFVITLFD